MKQTWIVVVTFLILFHDNVIADNPVISRPHLASIIGSRPVVSILKDSSGFLWIATESGLFRYDGAKVIQFNAKQSAFNHIPSSHVSQIRETNEGRIIAATYGAGLIEWNPDLGEFESAHSNGLLKQSDLHLRDILVSKEGRVWLMSSNKVLLHKHQGQIDQELNDLVRNSKLLNKPLAIEQGQADEILVATNRGIVAVNTNEVEARLAVPNTAARSNIGFATYLQLIPDQYLLAGTDEGTLIAYDPIDYTEISRITLPTSSAVSISGIVRSGDNLVVGTDGGIFLVDSKLTTATDISRTGHGLFSKEVTALEQYDDAVWVGTASGLELLKFSRFHLVRSSAAELSRYVTGFSTDSADRLWVSTYSGLFYYDPFSHPNNESINRFQEPELADERISAVSFDKQDLWIAYYHGGIQILNTNEKLLRNHGKVLFKDRMFTRILHDIDHSESWLATFGSGLARLPTSDPREENTRWYLSDKRVLNVIKSSSGSLFAASLNALYKYNRNTDSFEVLAEIDLDTGQVSAEIYAIGETSSGNIFLGTKDYGIFRLQASRARTDGREFVERLANLPFSTVYSIEIDDVDNLWCSTDIGIVKLTSHGEFVAKFTKTDGVQGNDFELGASFKNSKGELFFGGPDGYNRFHPDDIEIDQTVPEVRLTDVEFPEQGRTVIWDHRDTERVVLTHKDRSVTFRFSILDYTNPTQNQFRYKLDGFDTDWQEAGAASFAKYTNLPAGDYTFRVQAANPAGIWNTDGLAVSVSKSPPPWLSWWAFIIYACAFLILWWASNRIYQSYTFRRRTEELQHEKLALEIRSHDELQEQMEIQNQLVRSAYQHNSSTLSVLDTAITEALRGGSDTANSRARKWLQVLRTLERFLYYFADNPTANLHEFTNEVLSELAGTSQVPPETLVTINDVTTMYIPTASASPLALIIYELLENAVRHAFLPGSDANYLLVRLVQKQGTDTDGYLWELEVTDDGIGFEFDPGSVGPGLKLVRTLVNTLGGSLEVENVSGTRIRVVIPAESESDDLDNLALSA